MGLDQKIVQVLLLLEEKKCQFVRYDEVTDCMLSEPEIAILEKYITERDSLANKIDSLDASLYEKLSDWGDISIEMLAGRIELAELPSELHPVNQLCGQILDIVRRIRLKNSEIMSKYISLQEDNVEKIKESSNLPKINRYLSGLASKQKPNNFGLV